MVVAPYSEVEPINPGAFMLSSLPLKVSLGRFDVEAAAPAVGVQAVDIKYDCDRDESALLLTSGAIDVDREAIAKLPASKTLCTLFLAVTPKDGDLFFDLEADVAGISDRAKLLQRYLGFSEPRRALDTIADILRHSLDFRYLDQHQSFGMRKFILRIPEAIDELLFREDALPSIDGQVVLVSREAE